MKRGEVWWARLDPPIGTRPVVLVSRDDAYEQRQFVMVGLVTTRTRRIPSEVVLGPEDGLPRTSVVNLDSLETIRKARLQELISTLSVQKLSEVNDALRYALGLR